MHHRKHPTTVTNHDTGTRSGALLFVLLIAQLMVILDITAVNIALPSLAADLNLTGSTSAGRSRATRSSSGACCSSAGARPISSGGAGCS